MSTLDTWDWHYRIAFDQRLRTRVADVIQALPFAKHRALLERQYELFSENLSVAQLIAHLLDEEGDPQPAIDMASERTPLYLPEFLGEQYRTRIVASERLRPHQKADLLAITGRAQDQRFENRHRDIFEPVFGGALDGLLDKALHRVAALPDDRPIAGSNLRVLASEIVGHLRDKVPPRLQSLASSIPKFRTTVSPGAGFAEYWPTTLTGAQQNELIIYDNPDQLGYQNFQATLAHEVLGHGTFYAYASQAEPPFFDHGAMALIEGWATWCEWAASAPPFGHYLRSVRCSALRRFSLGDPAQIQRQIEADTALLGYSGAVAESGIEYFFQYPGFAYSYSLGALWFDERLRAQEPGQFLESLRGQPWGDFFVLW